MKKQIIESVKLAFHESIGIVNSFHFTHRLVHHSECLTEMNLEYQKVS